MPNQDDVQALKLRIEFQILRIENEDDLDVKAVALDTIDMIDELTALDPHHGKKLLKRLSDLLHGRVAANWKIADSIRRSQDEPDETDDAGVDD